MLNLSFFHSYRRWEIPQQKRSWLLFLAVIALAIIILFGRLGNFPLFNPDEGLYAEPAREMLETGQYLTTLLNYVVRYTKPPLVIWAMAACYQIFGVNEFAARFFSALCAVVLVSSTFLFARRELGIRCAFIAALCLITNPMFISVGREAITDMPLALFIAGSLMSFYTAFKERQALLKWLGYILLGLAVMTKGPVGALLPALTLLIFYIYTGKLKEAYRFFQLPIGVAIVLAIALPWFLAEVVATKGAYFHEFILRENLERFTSVVDSHKGAWWYHIAAVTGGFFPWSIFLPQAIVNLFRTNVFKKFSESAVSPLLLFASCWVVITIVFFSVSVSKLLPYTLPAFPALALIVAWELEQAAQWHSRWRLAGAYIVLMLLFAAGAMESSLIVGRWHHAPIGFIELIRQFGLYQVLALVLSGLFLVLNFKQLSIVFLLLSAVLGISCFGPRALELLSYNWEGDLAGYGRAVAGSKDPVIVYGLRKPGMPFYTHRKVIQVNNFDELNGVIAPAKQAYIITKTTNLGQFVSSNYKVARHDQHFALVFWQAATDISK